MAREDSPPTSFVAGGQHGRWYESPREYPVGSVERGRSLILAPGGIRHCPVRRDAGD